MAVEVPGMSVPQNGFDETGVKPVFPACITQVHCCGSSCPKTVEKSIGLGSRPLALYDLRPRRSLMTAARVGLGPASCSPLIMRSAPGPCLVLAEGREVALGEVRVLLHGRLHLLGAGVGQHPRSVEGREVVALQRASTLAN